MNKTREEWLERECCPFNEFPLYCKHYGMLVEGEGSLRDAIFDGLTQFSNTETTVFGAFEFEDYVYDELSDDIKFEDLVKKEDIKRVEKQVNDLLKQASDKYYTEVDDRIDLDELKKVCDYDKWLEATDD